MNLQHIVDSIRLLVVTYLISLITIVPLLNTVEGSHVKTYGWSNAYNPFLYSDLTGTIRELTSNDISDDTDKRFQPPLDIDNENIQPVDEGYRLASTDNIVPARSVKLVKQIIEFWNNNSQSISNNISPTIKLPSIHQLSHQFTEWFYTSWNNLSTFTSDHFFPDCQLTLIHENHRRILGAYYVCDTLRSYITSQDLRFYPNIQSNKVEESKHGLVSIQISGTIHQRGTCIGIFDQSFGLVRDPNHSNNYLIKFCFLNMQTQQQTHQPQLLSANQPIPTYLVDMMQNYDQTVQQQIDSTDYFIEDPDDDDDDDDNRI
ncbi:unnamed protein product [Adineta steineri]|uniref:Uncharacterized protein n=1 Tax=Adineta steineri TaxID=433720 RepID=A0A815NBZ8_9BILA|nr:unnamed protein product [Adineta steineri]CAF1435244.1 unnamed protein product [Adineta steineri]